MKPGQRLRPYPPRLILLTLLVAGCLASPVLAWEQYSENGDATNCATCHGGFRASNYVSNVDGAAWNTSLHDGHRSTMLNGDCDVCHSGSHFPVRLASSNGGAGGLDPISCVGCHGRAEDEAAPGAGYGAGLRQKHQNAGLTICFDCHDDAFPGMYTPVGEEVLPPYYSSSDPFHPNIPASSCNEAGSETYFGPTGLDNDGDLLYDGDDPDCSGSTDVPVPSPTRALLIENHPNPFNPTTEVRYSLPAAGPAVVEVYTVQGALVKTLADSPHMAAGAYSVSWNGLDNEDRSVSSGIYFVKVRTEGGSKSAKMVMLR